MSNEKNTNALKHGAFAKEVILPEEDLAEFEALYNSLIEEWQPVGATQHDKVANLAECLWRRKRVRRFRHRYIAKVETMAKIWRKHDESLIISVSDLLSELEEELKSGSSVVTTEEGLMTKLEKVGAGEIIPRRIYERDLARKKFKTDNEWLDAVLDKYWAALQYYEGKVANESQHFEHLYDEEVLSKNMKLEERLEAMSDRIIKSLCQIKTMHEIVIRHQNSSVVDGCLNQVASPPIQEIHNGDNLKSSVE